MKIATFAILILVVAARDLPPQIQKCDKNDPKLGECIMEAVQILKNGNKDLGLIPLEPIFVPRIDLGNSSNGGAVQIHQIYENFKLYNVTNGKVTDLKMDLSDENCQWSFKTFSEIIFFEADYTMTGRLLLFPINGHGKCKITLYDSEADYKVECKKRIKRNKKFIHITNITFNIKPKNIVFDFENIIDGNEILSREVGKAVNENALSVYADVGPAFDKAMGEIFRNIYNHVFSKVPEDKLFL